ncbi:mitochondrial 2-oxodicarboxylate carrier isoform X2 [Nilaparvata lugens]|uniref:mitochondrial 2-oxodicarboxylate carrier isoform X1 n=1 Tax=Nilaparvata lugens TaxID=108931 RepID=UPI00193CE02C|nr:mitochondrial 2-oxodicarboxylate carrier isoform X1 [Nilaparvata lugens]XP_039293265.1 mitochondrial 2-oxodicarboxylate carrier isoform X1 [Nilaparvata lugens]XP_039293266.1 mitochondrial 2-oxodicarboxylate carrier isoform X1 [Nilaparvata lugens]XP_039293267.1 mitochondrial 2-oxodicarboxylate carrier isoform X1 [Nilaparvata lugens]XP_039293268.1 mitochondrial 2-oxodicarboxylate carrier isoform X1 [Nilaparvata lugens]XP_039293269.1 mitochondrial 2-oxodicarboxylate carrier isoform X2 [Nilapar
MHSNSLLKEAAIQILSGGSAGFVEVCIMHPLDVVKTRLQVQSAPAKVNDPNHYKGVFDCMAKMYRNEGYLAFYKGILPPIVAETPKRALKFVTFEQYKKLFLFGASSPTPLTLSMAGFFAGVTEAIFVNPFEVVKVTMQTNHQKAVIAPSTFQVCKQIVNTNGLGGRGLYRGLTATVLRNGVFNSVYFGFFYTITEYLPKLEDPVHEFMKRVSLGFTAGVFGSLANIPFDVAKSRIQGPQPAKGEIKYKSCFKTMHIIYTEEGFRALYKGLVPKVMRLGPGGAILLICYEQVKEFLTEKLE